MHRSRALVVPSRRLIQWSLSFVLSLAMVEAGRGDGVGEGAGATPLVSRSSTRRPLILVPGATGVELVDSQTGELLWGSGRTLLAPHDRGASLARPLVPGFDDPVVAGKVMREVRIGPVRKPVYGPWIAAMESQGYVLGDLDAPAPAATLFLFSYDWRQDNVSSTARLVDGLRRLRQAHGGNVEVDLVCQSNGAHICRWLAKYGDASLEEAEAGSAGPLEGVQLVHSVLVGSANGGSLRVLRLMHQGRRYVPLFGRRMGAATLFTFPSLFQELPVFAEDLFVDEQGHGLAIDIFEASRWEELGWSIFSPEHAKQVADEPGLGNRETWRAHLELQLDRAARFQSLLRQDSSAFAVDRYVVLQQRGLPTDRRAVVDRRRRGWQLRFAGEAGGDRRALARLLVEPGDGHATASSQLWLSPQEVARLEGGAPFLVEGGHFEMILDDRALEIVQSLLSRSRTVLRTLDAR